MCTARMVLTDSNGTRRDRYGGDSALNDLGVPPPREKSRSPRPNESGLLATFKVRSHRLRRVAVRCREASHGPATHPV